MKTVAAAPMRFEYVEEQDVFLALFPHRYDYLYAVDSSQDSTYHTESCIKSYTKPQWRTERRFPLSDRTIVAGDYLYGVRFGHETRYCLIDIDIGSRYHPVSDPFALTPVLEALEPLGLVCHLACTSSVSGGIHLYFPFDSPQHSGSVGAAVTQALKQAGICIQPGQAEVFPNPRGASRSSPSSSSSLTTDRSTSAHLSLFNGHRLPLQTGSWLLDADGQYLGCDREAFVAQWRFCAAQNHLDSQTLKQALYISYCRNRLYSYRVKKFFNDLNVEIEAGWTGQGQTNRLLGRIAMRSYIFHHVVYGGEPLEGEALVQNIAEVARSLPGYADWCRHQHEIEERAQEWARAVENSHYFHYGDRTSQSKQGETHSGKKLLGDRCSLSRNSQQAEKTQIKIRTLVQTLLHQGQLPDRPTDRFRILTTYKISGTSLYKYKELWHPNYWNTSIYNLEPLTSDTDMLNTSILNTHIDNDIDTETDIDLATAHSDTNSNASNKEFDIRAFNIRDSLTAANPFNQLFNQIDKPLARLTSLFAVIGCNSFASQGFAHSEEVDYFGSGCNSSSGIGSTDFESCTFFPSALLQILDTFRVLEETELWDCRGWILGGRSPP